MQLKHITELNSHTLSVMMGRVFLHFLAQTSELYCQWFWNSCAWAHKMLFSLNLLFVVIVLLFSQFYTFGSATWNFLLVSSACLITIYVKFYVLTAAHWICYHSWFSIHCTWITCIYADDGAINSHCL